MPLYEYKCPKCQEPFDQLLEEPEESVECVFCNGRALRVFSPPHFILKGQGWPGKEIKETNDSNRT